MTDATKNGNYFWLLNLLLIAIVFGLVAKTIYLDNERSEYRFRLNEVTHYIAEGFSLDGDLTGALEIAAGENVRADLLWDGGRMFLLPGEKEYREFTIAARFDYTSQYDALKANTDVTPGLMLPELGDNYQIYLNGSLVASEWHVKDGDITVHKLACGTVYSINPNLFIRGENTLTYRICGDYTSSDTGLTVTGKYIIDDLKTLGIFDYPQTVFAGIYLAVGITFLMFFLLYREKRLNLWFSATALSMSLYSFFRAGAFRIAFQDYELALRLEVLSLFTCAYFIAVLLYTCDKDRFNVFMKIYTGIYALFFVAVFLPGHQFILDMVKVFFVLFVPCIVYAFASSLCVPIVKEVKEKVMRSEGSSALIYTLHALSGTLRGNMIIGAFVPIVLALADQIAYVVFSYQEIVLLQYGFLFFFANVTFALASDNAETHGRLIQVSEELRAVVSEREFELAQKSGEVEEFKTAQMSFREAVLKDIRAPIGEIIGAIELQMLRPGVSTEMTSWLSRLLDAQHNIRKKLDVSVGDELTLPENTGFDVDFNASGARYSKALDKPSSGETRHLFVINPKSFVTLRDLKDFLLSIEMCFSAGHRAEYKIYISRYPRDAYSAVHRYLSSTPEDETARVYAVGGDGILFDCLNGLAPFPNAELAPIPYGNANDFARAFGAENMNLFRDVKLMSKSPHRLVDVILCGEQYALCDCSIGIEGKAVHVFSGVIEKINSGKARSFVPLLYKIGAMKSLLDGSMNNMNYRLTIDGKEHSGEYLLVNIANIALNGGSNTPSPFSVPDDGILDAIICKSSSALNSFKMLPAYTSGQFYKFPDYFEHHRLKEAHCECDQLMSVVLDGETFYTHELDLKILPKAVKIVSPNGIGFADFSKIVKGDRE